MQGPRKFPALPIIPPLPSNRISPQNKIPNVWVLRSVPGSLCSPVCCLQMSCCNAPWVGLSSFQKFICIGNKHLSGTQLRLCSTTSDSASPFFSMPCPKTYSHPEPQERKWLEKAKASAHQCNLLDSGALHLALICFLLPTCLTDCSLRVPLASWSFCPTWSSWPPFSLLLPTIERNICMLTASCRYTS